MYRVSDDMRLLRLVLWSKSFPLLPGTKGTCRAVTWSAPPRGASLRVSERKACVSSRVEQYRWQTTARRLVTRADPQSVAFHTVMKDTSIKPRSVVFTTRSPQHDTLYLILTTITRLWPLCVPRSTVAHCGGGY